MHIVSLDMYVHMYRPGCYICMFSALVRPHTGDLARPPPAPKITRPLSNAGDPHPTLLSTALNAPLPRSHIPIPVIPHTRVTHPQPSTNDLPHLRFIARATRD